MGVPGIAGGLDQTVDGVTTILSNGPLNLGDLTSLLVGLGSLVGSFSSVLSIVGSVEGLLSAVTGTGLPVGGVLVPGLNGFAGLVSSLTNTLPL